VQAEAAMEAKDLIDLCRWIFFNSQECVTHCDGWVLVSAVALTYDIKFN